MADLRVPDLNKVIIAGRLTRDPDLRYTGGGRPYCRCGLANTRYYKDKDGNRQEETLFVDLSIWGPHAEFVGERLRKGRPVLAEGKLRSYEFEERDTGQKRTKIEIQADRVTALDWDENYRGGGGGAASGAAAGGAGAAASSRSYDDYGGGPSGPPPERPAPSERPAPRVIEEPIPEDDIPF
jgi:single-strand DNA-binding protein